MTELTSTQLLVGEIYTRANLREMFSITAAALKNGIFQPKNTQSLWLFVTEEKTPDRVQYTDHLDGDVLLMQGQTEGRTDHLLTNQVVNGLELLVFHRMHRYEHAGAGFKFLGPFHYIRSFGHRPTSFVLTRDTGRKYKYGKQTWRWVLEAVQQLGGTPNVAEISEYITSKVPEFDLSNIDPDLRLISVNEYGRSAWHANRVPRRTDGWSPIDALFRRGPKGNATYETYDPDAAVHGVWEQTADEEGIMRPRLVTDCPELVLVQRELEASSAENFEACNEEDARKRVMVSIAQRRGQSKFRQELLVAYEGRCAVTGCALQAILEGAHIKPYRGVHTNHVTNGLLLRADIHTLFDLRLLRVNPSTWTIEVSAQARSSYGSFHGQPLQRPTSPHLCPDITAVSKHYESCAESFSATTPS